MSAGHVCAVITLVYNRHTHARTHARTYTHARAHANSDLDTHANPTRVCVAVFFSVTAREETRRVATE